MANGQMDMNELLRLLQQMRGGQGGGQLGNYGGGAVQTGVPSVGTGGMNQPPMPVPPQGGPMGGANPQAGVMQTTPGQTGMRPVGGHIGVMPRGGQQIPGLVGGPGMNQPDIRQIYAALAQGNRPEQALGGYAGYLQGQEARREQTLAQQNPTEQYLRLYGNVNPADWTPESLREFETQRQQGNFDLGLLVEKDSLKNPEIAALNKAIETSQQTERDQFQALTLAQQFDQFPEEAMRGRLAGGVSEWLKGMVGSEDEVTALLTNYNRVVNKLVIGALPPGVASDRDIQLARDGFPGQFAHPAVIASYMRGVAKAMAIEQAQARHKADYLSAVRQGRVGLEGLLQDWELKKGDYVTRALDTVGGINTADPYDYYRSRQTGTRTTNPNTGGGPGERGEPKVVPTDVDAVGAEYGVDLSY